MQGSLVGANGSHSLLACVWWVAGDGFLRELCRHQTAASCLGYDVLGEMSASWPETR